MSLAQELNLKDHNKVFDGFYGGVQKLRPERFNIQVLGIRKVVVKVGI